MLKNIIITITFWSILLGGIVYGIDKVQNTQYEDNFNLVTIQEEAP